MKGRPAIYATFSSYDEVAHHSGLERADTLEALRKLDQQFARIDRARRYAPRPYEIVVLSDHGQTQGATFKQRNGYGARRARRALPRVRRRRRGRGRRRAERDGRPCADRGDRAAAAKKRPKNDVSRPGRDRARVRKPRPHLPHGGAAAPHARGDRAAPSTAPAGASRASPRRLAPRALRRARRGRPRRRRARATCRTTVSRATIRSRAFSPTAPLHLRRTDGFEHVADIMVGSFYDPELDEGCAFEELISFHGGLGGLQTRPFILYPATCRCPTSRSSAPQPSTTCSRPGARS